MEVISEAVAHDIEELDADLAAKLIHVSSLLTEFGPAHVREPYVKHLEGKLWEMRLKGKDKIARAIYVAAVG